MAVGRPLEFDPDQALDSAMQLFWRQGYESTSLQNLLETMGLSKSSFYQSFGNKHRLFERCIDRYRNNTVAGLRQGLEQSSSAWSMICGLLQGVIDEAEDSGNHRGCLVMNSATEFAQRDRTVAEQIHHSTSAFIQVFREFILRAQADGEIPLEKDADKLSRYLLSSLSGLHAMLKAGIDRKSAEELAEVILTALK